MANFISGIVPFPVPRGVHPNPFSGGRGEGFKLGKQIPLAELSTDALDELCAEFREAVFAAAGKDDPRAWPNCDCS